MSALFQVSGSSVWRKMTMLVEITSEEYGVDIALQYATLNNFTGRAVYARAACFLVAEAAQALRTASALVAPLGYRLRIFDAFRPSEAQWVLWAHAPDPEFLADPQKGSPHSMGAAVDLTLVDVLSGAELDMGTDFDAMVPRSCHGALDISPEAQRNRFILLGAMSTAGFDFYRKEWWHYQLFDARARYPVLSDVAAGTAMMRGKT